MLFSTPSLTSLATTVTFLLFSGVRPDETKTVSYPPFDQRCTQSQIFEYLQKLDQPDRSEFVSIALKFCDKRADRTLTKFLLSRNSNERHLAAYGWALTHDKKQRAIAVLTRALADPRPSVRLTSARALGEVVGRRDYFSGEVKDVPESVLQALLTLLRDPESSVRTGAALSLIKLGRKPSTAGAALIEGLKDNNSDVRAKSAEGLGKIGKLLPLTSTAVPALIASLKDQDVTVRASAAEALGEIGRDATLVVPALRRALGDREQFVRGTAAQAVGKFGTQASSAIPELLATLNQSSDDEDLNFWFANAVTDSLVKIGKAAIPGLLAILNNKKTQALAIDPLGDFGADAKSAVPALIPLLAEENIGGNAAWAIGKIAKSAREVVPVLLLATRDKNPTVRANASYGLGALEEDKGQVVPFFIAGLENSDIDLRSEAAHALGRIGRAAVPALTEALENRNTVVRAGAALAFWYMVRSNPNVIPYDSTIINSAIPALRTALNDGEDVVRSRAIIALSELDQNAKNLPPMPATALTDENALVRRQAIWKLAGTDPALNQQIISVSMAELRKPLKRGDFDYFDPSYAFEKLGKDVIPPLVDALNDPDPSVRSAVIHVLGKLKGQTKHVLSPLINALADKDSNVYRAAAYALRDIEADIKAGTPALILALRTWDDNEDLRAAVSCLVKIGSSAVAELIILLNDKRPETRVWAATALGNMGKNSKDAVLDLSRALQDREPRVRSAVVSALIQISYEVMKSTPNSKDFEATAKTAIPALLETLKDEDEGIRFTAAATLQLIATYDVTKIIEALKNDNANVRKGSAFALGGLKEFPPSAIQALKSLVEDENEVLEVRRVAASILSKSGIDMESFFSKYNLLSPQNAGCPGIPYNNGGTEHFRFSIYTGRCMDAGYSGPMSGGSSLYDYIKKLFGG